MAISCFQSHALPCLASGAMRPAAAASGHIAARLRSEKQVRFIYAPQTTSVVLKLSHSFNIRSLYAPYLYCAQSSAGQDAVSKPK